MSDLHILDWHSDSFFRVFSISYNDYFIVVNADETVSGEGGLVVEQDAGGD